LFHKIIIKLTNEELIDEINCNTKSQVVFDKSKAKIKFRALLKKRNKKTNKKSVLQAKKKKFK
jgi:hypothetical protein